MIITGYNEFFNSHEQMTISSLRTLRRSIIDTISKSEDILTRARITEQQESIQRLREDKILDFYVEYYAKISESGLEKTLDTSLVSYLAEKQIYIRSESELSKAKEKVKSIDQELNSK